MRIRMQPPNPLSTTDIGGSAPMTRERDTLGELAKQLEGETETPADIVAAPTDMARLVVRAKLLNPKYEAILADALALENDVVSAADALRLLRTMYPVLPASPSADHHAEP
jgi:hypothetical protein